MEMEGENDQLKRRLLEQEDEIRRGMEEWAVEIRSLDEQRERLQAKLVAVEESHNKETKKNVYLQQELEAAARKIEALDQAAKNAAAQQDQGTTFKIELKATQDRLDRLMSEMTQKESECLHLQQMLQEEQQRSQKAKFAQHSHDSVVKSLNAQIDFMAERIATFEDDELRANDMELQVKKLQRQVNKLTAERDGLIQELEAESLKRKSEPKTAKRTEKQRHSTHAAADNPTGPTPGEMSSLAQENRELRQLLDASSKEKNELMMNIERIQREAKAKDPECSERVAKDQKRDAQTIAELQLKIEDAENACSALEKQMNENIKFHEQEKQSFERRIADLNLLVESDRVEIAELKNLIASLDEASTSLTNKLKCMAQERSELLRKLSEVESTMMKDRQQLDDARFDKERHQLIVDDYERRNKELAQKLTLAEKKVDDAQAEAAKLLRSSEQTKANADIVTMKSEQLQHTLKGKDEEMRLKQQEVSELTEMFQASIDECRQKEKEVQAAHAERDNVMLEAKLLGSKLHAARKHLSSVEQERNAFQERLRLANQALSQKEQEVLELLNSYRELGDDAVRLESELMHFRKQRNYHPPLAQKKGTEEEAGPGNSSETSALNKHIVSLTNKLVLAEKERSKLRDLLERASTTVQKQNDRHTTNPDFAEDFELRGHPTVTTKTSVPQENEDDLGANTPSPRSSSADQLQLRQEHEQEHNGISPPCSPVSPGQFSALKEDLARERDYYVDRRQGSRDKQSSLERDFEMLLGKVCSLGYTE